jgi:indole-3-glycerol phosphate synthase
VNLIAEVKKASPSRGIIRADFDPVAIARAYAQAGAQAISVLTDEQYFQGKLEYLRDIRQQVALPILRKDFIIDPWQVYQSRQAGADAILLIAAAMSVDQLVELMARAGELGMAVLVEVHNARELEQLWAASDFPPAGVDWLMGVNNRDLTTFAVELATTLNLLPQMPLGVPVISESGIATPQDVQRLAKAGVRGILVGETFMRQDDIAQAVDRLLGPVAERQG